MAGFDMVMVTTNLKETLKFLEASVMNTINELEHIEPSNLPFLLKAFKQLNEDCSTLDALKKIIDAAYDKLSYEVIPTAMTAQEIDSVKIAGRVFFLNARLHASIPEAKREVGFAWLKENKYESLIKEGVNAQSLSAAMKAYFEENGKMPPEEAITVHTKTYTAIRKA